MHPRRRPNKASFRCVRGSCVHEWQSPCVCVHAGANVPQRQEPISCCTSSSLVRQKWQRLAFRCLATLRDEAADNAERDDGDGDSSSSGTSVSLARFLGKMSLSGDTTDHKNRRQRLWLGQDFTHLDVGLGLTESGFSMSHAQQEIPENYINGKI